MTFHHMLRRYFGAHHFEGIPGSGWVYSAKDLERDLTFDPSLKSLGGHAMRPYMEFGSASARLRWYTVLREPVARSISNYQHQVEKRNVKISFLKWLSRPKNQNWHVRMLAGDQDLVAAKQILTERILCFGLIERYNEFLLLLRNRMDWQGFNLTYQRVRNPARTNSVRAHIQENMDKYSDALAETNNLDHELYTYASKVLYPRQIEAYGTERMEKDLATAFANPYESAAEKWRLWNFRVVGKIAYPAFIKVTNTFTRSQTETG